MKVQYTSVLLAANGGTNGILTVPSTLPFAIGCSVMLTATGLSGVSLVIDAIISSTQLSVKQAADPNASVPLTQVAGRFNASSYTTALAATLTQQSQDIMDLSAVQDYLMRRMDALNASLIFANGRKQFVQVIAFTTTSAFTTFNATTAEGATIPPNAIWVFQPDVDCQMLVAGASAAVTNTNSLWVQATQQEWQMPLASDTGVNVKGRSGSGNLMVFAVF